MYNKSVFRSTLILAALVLVVPSIVNACVCMQIDMPIDKVRDYYKRSFMGAVFTGKIRTIRDLPLAESDELAFPMRELVIDIEQYWLGVKEPMIKAYTLGENTSCTVEWETGKTLFFIASRQDDGPLAGLGVGSC